MRTTFAALGLLVASVSSPQAQELVVDEHKISSTAGGFGGPLVDDDRFGCSTAYLGDLDGDGVGDVAAGAFMNSDGGLWRGALWILFLNADGTVKSEVEIGSGLGGFGGTLANGDHFGWSVANLDDLDGDGVIDLAVGAHWDNDGGGSQGAVWILFMNTNGTVKSEQKISALQGGLSGAGSPLDPNDHFGSGVANLGDLDGDGITDLAVGAFYDDDGGMDRGAVYILFLDTDGTVQSKQKISSLEGGFGGVLDDEDALGWGVGNIGDVDGDGVTDIAVNAYEDDDGGTATGALWILFLNTDGTVKDEQKISDTQGGFTWNLEDHDHFGSAPATVGDLDGDGIPDLAVGVWLDNDGIGTNVGAVYLLFLNANGTVKFEKKISADHGGFDGPISDNDWFGSAVHSMGDWDGDGGLDLIVGQYGDDDGGNKRGAVWILSLTNMDAAATATVRNGSGTNDVCFTNVVPPKIGASWISQIDASSHPGAGLTFILGYDTPLAGVPTPFGELLIANEVFGGTFVMQSVAPSGGGIATHTSAVPADPCFAGLEVYTQGIILGGGAELCNALDLVVGQ